MNARVPNLSRRHFVVGTTAVSSGLALGIQMTFVGSAQAAEATPEIGAWVVIKPDDTVIVRVVRSEMGQGTITGLAQLVAEELECNWKKVTVEYPTPGESLKRKRVWGAFSTGGSRGIRTSEQYVRKGGAAARLMLVQAAADGWSVPVAECVAAESVITHKPSGRKVTFGKVAAAASKLAVPTDASITLKDPKDWKIIGKPLNRIDTYADKVTGKQVYGIDLKMPGMLVANIKECPVFGGKVKSFDASKVTGIKGVKKVMQVGETAIKLRLCGMKARTLQCQVPRLPRFWKRA
jgi:isoquinoline 1-oxidoreductase beta subunit